MAETVELPLTPIERINAILERNKDKDFVQRILRPAENPWIDNPDGSRSTHLMAWGEADGKYHVFPTILRDGEKLTNYADKAFGEALKRKESIEFDTPEEAEWFSMNYKQVWPEAMR